MVISGYLISTLMLVETALICREIYGTMPITIKMVTSPPRVRLLLYREEMKSAMVVMRWVLHMRMILRRRVIHRRTISDGPMYTARNSRPEEAARPTLP